MNRIAGLCLFVLALLLLLIVTGAFGETLPPRPPGYQPIDYLSTSCSGLSADTTVFRFGLADDVLWAEIYVEDTPGHQQLIAVAAYGPGERGVLIFANILTPSGSIIHFDTVEALQASPYAQVCQVAALWLYRS